MTSNNLHNKIKTRLLLALMIIGLICTSLFFFTACGDENKETTSIPKYNYTDVDDGLISNPNFIVGTADTELKSFPLTSTTGWSRSKDSSGLSSSSKSGIIDVSTDGWKSTMKGLYTDSYYLEYLMKVYNFNKEDVKSAIKNSDAHKADSSYNPTNEEIKDYIVDNYMVKNVANPGVKAGATDNKIYMLNNYTSNYGWGASQKITSSKEVVVKKGEIVKVTVSLFTQNISGVNGEDYGATIRLNPYYNGNVQSDFVIANIKTNGWETYTIYIKGDTDNEVKFKLALGLGYNVEYTTQGTVYFDDVVIEKVDSIDAENEIPAANKTQFTYASKDALIVDVLDANVDKTKAFVYDMKLSINDGYYKSIDTNIVGNFTESTRTNESDSPITSKDKFTDSSVKYTVIENDVEVEKDVTSNYAYTEGTPLKLNNASYSLTISSADFKVPAEKYAYVSFELCNNLNKFTNTQIYISVLDVTHDEEYNNITYISEVDDTDELTTHSIIVRNHYTEESEFNVVLTIGPSEISTTNYAYEYANGTIKVKNFMIANGDIEQYDENDEETENYAFYDLFTDFAIAGVDFNLDNSQDEEETDVQGFEISAVDLGNIANRPVVPKNFDGIVTKHIYLIKETEENKAELSRTVNDRIKGDAKGNYGGVVKSTTTAVSSYASNLTDDERALMILNNVSDSYGYITTDGTKTLPAGAYAKISLKVKVLDDGDANNLTTAYIYLVDTTTKQVMSFGDLGKLNAKHGKATDSTSNLFQIKVTEEDMINAEDGWLDVEFYIASGSESKSFRVELWNGDRTGVAATNSKGCVFFKDVEINLSASNFEPSSISNAFIGNENPLAKAGINSFEDYYSYLRPLTDTEKEFNKEYPNKAVSYSEKIVWAKNSNLVYAVFNNLEYFDSDPYATIEEETPEETKEGCKSKTDPATFWLSFSSILLAVVLVAAIIMLFLKNFLRKRKANASDAKSHYTVKSRVNRSKKVVENETIEETNVESEETPEETIEVENEQTTDEQPEENENTEDNSNEYIYGEVQDFGNDDKKE